MITKTLPAHQVRKGDFLVNIGEVTAIETADTAQLTAITVVKGICKSAAFYWYNMNEPLMIRRNYPATYKNVIDSGSTS